MAEAEQHLTITSCGYAPDGGSIGLTAVDIAGTVHSIVLVQHRRHTYHDGDRIPGRLYFDKRCIDIRSEEEKTLLTRLQEADIQLGPQHVEGESVSEHRLVLGNDIQAVFDRSPLESIRTSIKKIVDFVDSDEYLAFAKTVNLR